MSIISSLKQLVDPIQHRKEEAQRKIVRNLPQGENPGDPPSFRCRVCDLVSQQRSYCPECLADTMVPLAASTRGDL